MSPKGTHILRRDQGIAWTGGCAFSGEAAGRTSAMTRFRMPRGLRCMPACNVQASLHLGGVALTFPAASRSLFFSVT